MPNKFEESPEYENAMFLARLWSVRDGLDVQQAAGAEIWASLRLLGHPVGRITEPQRRVLETERRFIGHPKP